MKVEEIPFVFPPDPPRSGLHLSSIIKSILVKLDPKIYGRPIDDAARARFEVGYAFEDALVMRGRWAPGTLLQQEFTEDGIICTLDGLDVSTDTVMESKATYYSTSHGILGAVHASWKWQLMGYCYVSRCTRAQLDVLYLCGDYKPPAPVPKSYIWEFTKEELYMNWRMMLREKERMREKANG